MLIARLRGGTLVDVWTWWVEIENYLPLRHRGWALEKNGECRGCQERTARP